eukprot:TRINITY_DN15503_c0_g3_i2.p1 TRINITY_DN15503_c0_g3~~TRINITY_DN15503_c0_g3_i2.p1  ORF type:complete len:174 (+),score=43.87 TRINITY_DN15503_c0_g3_i2:176-697(+)
MVRVRVRVRVRRVRVRVRVRWELEEEEEAGLELKAERNPVRNDRPFFSGGQDDLEGVNGGAGNIMCEGGVQEGVVQAVRRELGEAKLQQERALQEAANEQREQYQTVQAELVRLAEAQGALGLQQEQIGMQLQRLEELLCRRLAPTQEVVGADSSDEEQGDQQELLLTLVHDI